MICTLCTHHEARHLQRHLVEKIHKPCTFCSLERDRTDCIVSTHFNRFSWFERISLERNEHLKQSVMDVNKHGLVLYNMPSSHSIVSPLRQLRPEQETHFCSSILNEFSSQIWSESSSLSQVKWDII